MNIIVWFETFTVVLSGIDTSKVPIPYFDLELFILVVLCSMLKLEEFNSENYRKTLVIKVSKSSFSKLRVRKKSYTKPN
jgi:hypothetical protein